MASPLSTNQSWDDANSEWAQVLNPVINNILIQGKLITGIALTSGVQKTFNHGLGKMMTGWFIADKSATGDVWRAQPFNRFTLTLQSNATTTIAIWVF